MAFVAAALLGPRRGKYNADGSVNAIPGHNIPMALIGTFILAFGWFGFNAGSDAGWLDLRIGVSATNTMLAGGGRRDHVDAVACGLKYGQARSLDEGERDARGAGGHHRACALRGPHRRRC